MPHGMPHDFEQVAGRRRNPWRLAIWGGAAALLALPAIAMRFTAEVDWGPEDFIVMGALLALACGGYEVATRLSGNAAYRAGAAVAILTVFLTVWVNLAVGMIGDEGNPANLLSGVVILVGLVGAILARFRARGVARALQAAAAAQGAMAVYALAAGDVVAALLVAFFMVPWLLGASLFLKAAEQGTP
jgi:hypothetical protein